MPTYTFRNIKTNEEKEDFISIAAMEALVKEGEWKQVTGAPTIVSGVGDTGALRHTDNGWKDMLGQIKKGSGKGNTIKL